MRWYKEWHGGSLDPRLLWIAAAAKVKPAEAAVMVWAARDHASQHADRGSIAGFQIGVAAVFYRMKPERIEAILAAMRDLGMIVNDRFADWEERQETPAQDQSRDRMRRLRERQRGHRETGSEDEGSAQEEQNQGDNIVAFPAVTGDDGGVTVEPSQRDGDLKRKEVLANASTARARDPGEFDRWWQAYPNKVSKGQAERAFAAARKLAGLDELIAGVQRYVATKPPDRQWRNPATWLNGKDWLDEPALIPGARVATGTASAGDVTAKASRARHERILAEQFAERGAA